MREGWGGTYRYGMEYGEMRRKRRHGERSREGYGQGRERKKGMEKEIDRERDISLPRYLSFHLIVSPFPNSALLPTSFTRTQLKRQLYPCIS